MMVQAGYFLKFGVLDCGIRRKFLTHSRFTCARNFVIVGDGEPSGRFALDVRLSHSHSDTIPICLFHNSNPLNCFLASINSQEVWGEIAKQVVAGQSRLDHTSWTVFIYLLYSPHLSWMKAKCTLGNECFTLVQNILTLLFTIQL